MYTYEIIANLDNPQQTDLSQNTSSTLWCFVIFWNSWFIPLIHHFLGTCGITHNLYCRQPGMCYGMNESGTEYHSKMVAIHKNSMAGGKKACPESPHLTIIHSRDPDVNMMLTLVSSSYF